MGQRNRRRLTPEQADGVRRVMMIELDRAGMPLPVVGAMFRCSRESVRLEVRKGDPVGLDPGLARAVAEDIRRLARTWPGGLAALRGWNR